MPSPTGPSSSGASRRAGAGRGELAGILPGRASDRHRGRHRSDRAALGRTDGEPAGTLKQTAYANALAFSPDGRLIAVGLGNGTVALWDVATRQPAGAIGTGGPTLYSVGFSGDGRVLATGASNGVVSLWNVKEALKIAAPGAAGSSVPPGGSR